MTPPEETIVVGMGEMQVTQRPSAVLTCLGLGSCIAICVYDPVSKVGGMAHVVLPSANGRDVEPSPKYADTALPLLLQHVGKRGALESRLIVKIAGGAQMSKAPGLDGIFNTGERNVETIKKVLGNLGVRMAASEVGGHYGRTVRLFVDSGRVTVTTAGSAIREL